MNATWAKHIAGLATLMVLFVSHSHRTAKAQVNVANGKLIIGGGGDYESTPFNTGGIYGTNNVTDGQNASDPANNSGAISEGLEDGSFWLGRQDSSTGYFVLDLGASVPIAQIVLFNTRNGPYDDRGTGNFTLKASNSIAAGPAGTGMDIVSPITIASGTLTSQTYPGAFNSQGNTPLVPNTFAPSNSGPFRYLRFDALSIGAALDRSPYFFPNGVGLNEIRVYSTLVPEPLSLSILAMVTWVGLSTRWPRRGAAERRAARSRS